MTKTHNTRDINYQLQNAIEGFKQERTYKELNQQLYLSKWVMTKFLTKWRRYSCYAFEGAHNRRAALFIIIFIIIIIIFIIIIVTVTI